MSDNRSYQEFVQLSLVEGMERAYEPACGPFYCTHEVVGAIWQRCALKAMCHVCGAIVRDFGRLP